MRNKLQIWSFNYLEGGYSEVSAECRVSARTEAEKHMKRYNINKTINEGSLKKGRYVSNTR